MGTIYLMGCANQRAERGLALGRGSARVSVQPIALIVLADSPNETDNLSGASPHQSSDSHFATLSSRNLACYDQEARQRTRARGVAGGGRKNFEPTFL